ncbi:PDR/VanB family oxidoreductase [Rhizobium sp. LjRoot30]|uniref:PDR/VanB family oxidoreductase n=1 Tax=Rhizobium sp. LjRoot30 TaxID=3342320 RepID=UPI003ECC5997
MGAALARAEMDGPAADGRFDARIVEAKLEAEDVVSFVLRAAGGGALPAWAPGAHIDLCLPSGLVRQYSLCGDPAERASYRIAVLRQADGRGGSREVHDGLRVGQTVSIAGPRNAFPLLAAPRYFFIAGGIGITPILPMVEQAQKNGADWRLVYGARSRNRLSFLDRLGRFDEQRVGLRLDEASARIDLDEAVAAARGGAEVYACGPKGLLDALEARFADEKLGARLHIERFAPAAAAVLPDDGSFRVILGRSGGHVDVPVGCSILEALRQAGHDHPCSCEQGFCGTCECRVLDGLPDHRDALLTEQERQAGKVMMPCVSRALTPTLTLDI